MTDVNYGTLGVTGGYGITFSGDTPSQFADMPVWMSVYHEIKIDGVSTELVVRIDLSDVGGSSVTFEATGETVEDCFAGIIPELTSELNSIEMWEGEWTDDQSDTFLYIAWSNLV